MVSTINKSLKANQVVKRPITPNDLGPAGKEALQAEPEPAKVKDKKSATPKKSKNSKRSKTATKEKMAPKSASAPKSKSTRARATKNNKAKTPEDAILQSSAVDPDLDKAVKPKKSRKAAGKKTAAKKPKTKKA